jgi:hypothetical protein
LPILPEEIAVPPKLELQFAAGLEQIVGEVRANGHAGILSQRYDPNMKGPGNA